MRSFLGGRPGPTYNSLRCGLIRIQVRIRTSNSDNTKLCGLELSEAKMAKLRVLFFLVSLVVWATKVDVPVFAQVQTTDKKARDMAGIEKLRQQDIAATLSRDPVALTNLPPIVLSRRTVELTPARASDNVKK